MLRSNQPGIVAYKFNSSSSSAIYTTLRDPKTGETSCDCPGWKFKKGSGPRSCKHTRSVDAYPVGNVVGGKTPSAVVPKTTVCVSCGQAHYVDGYHVCPPKQPIPPSIFKMAKETPLDTVKIVRLPDGYAKVRGKRRIDTD